MICKYQSTNKIISLSSCRTARTDFPNPLSRHPSLSSITSSMSSMLHPMSVLNCCRYVLASRPTLARPCEGVHRRTLLMSSFLLLQQECPACLVHQIWIAFEISGRWPYNCPCVGCCFQDLFNIARGILEQLALSFFFVRFVSVQVVHPYSSMDTAAAWKKLRFILSYRSDFHMTNSLSIAVHGYASRVLM